MTARMTPRPATPAEPATQTAAPPSKALGDMSRVGGTPAESTPHGAASSGASTPSDARRRGWCPGALRPMQSGDGLLVRIKPSCGILTLAQLDDISCLAQECGNGILELTSRGNLQLRGIRDAALAELTQALDRLKLLDASPEAEARRNVIASPLAGLDAAAFDTRAVANALQDELAAAADLASLSDKFGIVLDGGGRLPLHDVEADIRFRWTGEAFAISLAREGDGTQPHDWIATCTPDDVPAIALTLIRAFLHAADGARRMRSVNDATRGQIARACFDVAGNNGPPQVSAPNLDAAAAAIRLMGCLGQSPSDTSGDAAVTVASIGWPYGATSSAALRYLVAAAHQAGATELRLTPWRAILLPMRDTTSAASLLDQAAHLGLNTSADDPRRAVAACPGAPACSNGSTAIRTDADRFAAALAGILGPDLPLHVSGCAKGCARRQPAALTLVADSGRYGLVVNGTAADAPAATSTPDEAAETLASLARAMTQASDAPSAEKIAALAAALKEIQAA